jgi:hypothetical protein
MKLFPKFFSAEMDFHKADPWRPRKNDDVTGADSGDSDVTSCDADVTDDVTLAEASDVWLSSRKAMSSLRMRGPMRMKKSLKDSRMPLMMILDGTVVEENDCHDKSRFLLF